MKGQLRPGDEITTNIGRKYIVGEIVQEDDHEWVVPLGAHEYTYWIPVENITSFERKEEQ